MTVEPCTDTRMRFATGCRREIARYKEECGGLDYCKVYPLARSGARSESCALKSFLQPWCTFAEPDNAMKFLNRFTSEDRTGQQLTVSFWIRALPSGNRPLYPKFTIFSSLGDPQQALLEVSYRKSSGSVCVQVRRVDQCSCSQPVHRALASVCFCSPKVYYNSGPDPTQDGTNTFEFFYPEGLPSDQWVRADLLGCLFLCVGSVLNQISRGLFCVVPISNVSVVRFGLVCR